MTAILGPVTHDREHVPTDEELRTLLGEDFAAAFEELAIDGHGVLRNITDWQVRRAGPPPGPAPLRLLDAGEVTGRRVIYVDPDAGPIYHQRAASEVFEDTEGQWVKVVEEWRWQAWLAIPADRRPAECPRAKIYSLTNLWLDPTS
jgi:hypothetical protein